MHHQSLLHWPFPLRAAVQAARPSNMHSIHSCREEALAAHEAAAAKSLRENNAGKGRGAAELDLHGLHTSEAVAALDAHLRGTDSMKRRGTKRVFV